MTNMIETSARFLLFGTKLDSRIDAQTVLMHKGSNLVRSFMGMPPNRGPGWTDLLMAWGKRIMAGLLGATDQQKIPADMPLRLFQTVDTALRNRGGVDSATQAPYFWANAKQTVSTPFFWSVAIDYQPTAAPDKIYSFELALEDQLARAGYDFNVRILAKPMRLEIDKPMPPKVLLADLWNEAKDLTINQRQALVGKKYKNGQVISAIYTATGEDFSAFIVGSPGAGKSILAIDIVLTMALTNAPSYLTMIIIDPKAIDFTPFSVLPHLALPVVTEPSYAVEVVQALCDEMDRRTACAARGDTSFLESNIMLYVDEMADLLNSLPTAQADQLAKNFQRLTQKGRGVGYVVIAATQRVHEVPAPVHSKLNCRFVGRTRNALDSTAASGVAGSTTHKLPGKGAFEVFADNTNGGLRIQSALSAESNKPGYKEALQPFFNDIIERWQDDSGPGWIMPGQRLSEDQMNYEFDPALLDALRKAYLENPEKFNNRLLRKVFNDVTGSQIGGKRSAVLFQSFLKLSATFNDGSAA